MEGVIRVYSIDHSVDVTIDEGWQGLQRLGLRSTVSFSRRQDGRVAMEGFPVYSTHQFQLWVLTVLLRLAWIADKRK